MHLVGSVSSKNALSPSSPLPPGRGEGEGDEGRFDRLLKELALMNRFKCDILYEVFAKVT
jgi:hypothetical protein